MKADVNIWASEFAEGYGVDGRCINFMLRHPEIIEGATKEKDKDGNVVVSKLNEQMCSGIAQAGGGVYVRSDNSNAAQRTVSRQLDALAKNEMDARVFSEYNEQFQSFAFIALFLMLIEFFVFSRKNKWLSRIRLFDVKVQKN